MTKSNFFVGNICKLDIKLNQQPTTGNRRDPRRFQNDRSLDSKLSKTWTQQQKKPN